MKLPGLPNPIYNPFVIIFTITGENGFVTFPLFVLPSCKKISFFDASPKK